MVTNEETQELIKKLYDAALNMDEDAAQEISKNRSYYT